jgi:hypothetical protein
MELRHTRSLAATALVLAALTTACGNTHRNLTGDPSGAAPVPEPAAETRPKATLAPLPPPAAKARKTGPGRCVVPPRVAQTWALRDDAMPACVRYQARVRAGDRAAETRSGTPGRAAR